MNIRLFVVLLALLPFSSANVFAQKLDTVTGLRLEYWRAFHDLIQQEILITNSGEIALNTTITPIRQPGEAPPKPKHTVKTIAERDLAPVLKFFNDAEVRQFFATHDPEPRLDGASLSLTVTQHSFSMAFHSLDAFTGSGARYESALGRLAVELFKLAGVTITKDDLY